LSDEASGVSDDGAKSDTPNAKRQTPNADTPTRRHADTPRRRHADTPTRRHAATPTRRDAETPPRRHAATPTRRHAVTPSRRHAVTPSRPPACRILYLYSFVLWYSLYSLNNKEEMPTSVLYATSARIGGIGLDAVALETLRGIHDCLGLAISFGVKTREIHRNRLKTLRFHSVRLLSNLERKYYYGAKKKAIDAVAARHLRTGRFDFFHGWSGEAFHSLGVTKALGIPSVLEVPTWHRQKGKVLPPKTDQEIALESAPIPQRWLNRLLISRHESLQEYENADVILVLSEKAAETFRVLGTPDDKLFRMSRGVDVQRFEPGESPPIFRALFVGALIKRKGVPLLLEAWKRLELKNAELWLAGHPHPEIKPVLENLPSSVKLLGFVKNIAEVYRACSVHIFPSELEGSAKSTYEAAACGLAQISTRESGDVVIDGENGLIIPANDVSALCDAILTLYRNPELVRKFGTNGRHRVVESFTWEHFRLRLREAYRTAMQRHSETAESPDSVSLREPL
jgi:glycosyltransferase involved in cell wall biosynthesis